MPQARLAPALALALLVPACFTTDDGAGAGAGDDADLGTTEQALCNSSFCGGNSPEVAHYPIHELNLDGTVSPEEKWKYLGMSQNGVVYDLVVYDSRLYAFGRGGALKDYDLLGALLYVQHGTQQYAIVIDRVDPYGTTEVVEPYSWLEVYGLNWAHVGANQLPGPISAGYEGPLPELEPDVYAVCPDPTAPGREPWDESYWMPPWGALVFEGDRISAKKLTVAAAADDRWFNIGCSAHTLNKLRLTRSTMHTAKDWAQVQATLKMLSADYCNHGVSYTVAGEPLLWRNDQGFGFWNGNYPTSLEARWSPYGALCLGEPRLAYTTNPDAQARFPDIWNAIYSDPYCASLPSCWDWDPYDHEFSDELITSGNWDY